MGISLGAFLLSITVSISFALLAFVVTIVDDNTKSSFTCVFLVFCYLTSVTFVVLTVVEQINIDKYISESPISKLAGTGTCVFISDGCLIFTPLFFVPVFKMLPLSISIMFNSDPSAGKDENKSITEIITTWSKWQIYENLQKYNLVSYKTFFYIIALGIQILSFIFLVCVCVFNRLLGFQLFCYISSELLGSFRLTLTLTLTGALVVPYMHLLVILIIIYCDYICKNVKSHRLYLMTEKDGYNHTVLTLRGCHCFLYFLGLGLIAIGFIEIYYTNYYGSSDLHNYLVGVFNGTIFILFGIAVMGASFLYLFFPNFIQKFVSTHVHIFQPATMVFSRTKQQHLFAVP